MKEKCHIFENISNYTIRYDGSNLYLKLEYPDVDEEQYEYEEIKGEEDKDFIDLRRSSIKNVSN